MKMRSHRLLVLFVLQVSVVVASIVEFHVIKKIHLGGQACLGTIY